jgi:succinyl-CoA synthetase beta subunit
MAPLPYTHLVSISTLGERMKIHEYQAKELLAAAGAAIPKGIVVRTSAEAVAAWDTLGGPVVLKAQVHAGGRGKGRFKDSGKDFGGVRFLTSRDEVAPTADVMFTFPLVTKQTGDAGQKVSTVLVQHAADIAREIYVGMVLDRERGVPILMACAEGGVDIEEVAARTPEKILKEPVSPELGLQSFQARKMAFALGFTGEQVGQAEKIFLALAKVYFDKDCSLAEINPLIVTPQGEVVALDAKITFDDNALFRHADCEKLRDVTEEDPLELRAWSTARGLPCPPWTLSNTTAATRQTFWTWAAARTRSKSPKRSASCWVMTASKPC